MSENEPENEPVPVEDNTNPEPEEETEKPYVSPGIAAARQGQVVVFDSNPEAPEPEVVEEVDPHQHEGH